MTRLASFVFLTALLTPAGANVYQSRPTDGAASTTTDPIKGSVRVRNDLPNRFHLRNTGGSDGAGLCVFASISHSARWQDIDGLKDMMEWMRRYPGGGYPDKVDAMIERKLGPSHNLNYIHAYGERAVPLIRRAARHGYLVCVTYGYGERYGESINHMVNMAHLDDQWAVILDNNFPNSWEWMSPEEFKARADWGTRGAGELWAIIFVTNPQPPVPRR